LPHAFQPPEGRACFGCCVIADTSNGFIVKKNVFSGKAFANVNISSALKIISLNPNSFKVQKQMNVQRVEQLTVAVDAPK
jgi:electron transfer flavoprotein alpha subunit